MREKGKWDNILKGIPKLLNNYHIGQLAQNQY